MPVGIPNAPLPRSDSHIFPSQMQPLYKILLQNLRKYILPLPPQRGRVVLHPTFFLVDAHHVNASSTKSITPHP